MSHPITGNRRAVLIYMVVWLGIAILHAFLMWYFLRFRVDTVVADALISGLLFGFLGLLAWYPTRYIPFQRHSPVYSLMAHVVAGLLVLLTWILVSVGLLNAFFSNQSNYIEFLNGSLVSRAILGGLIYLVLVLVYYLVSSSQKLQERVKQEERLKGLVRDAELNMLKSQINPHFLFNSLNSISSLTMTNPDEARDMIIRLSDLLRYSLKHRENEFVTLKEELSRIKDYLAIEKIRFGEKLQYEFHLNGDCDEFLVPTMIFQPLFENAIRHSVYESVDPVTIKFHCSREGGYMRTVVSNDFDSELPSRGGTGVGLQNVRQRVQLSYQEQGTVTWGGAEGIFTVTIVFPPTIVKRNLP